MSVGALLDAWRLEELSLRMIWREGYERRRVAGRVEVGRAEFAYDLAGGL